MPNEMKAMLSSELIKPGPTDLSRGLSHRPFVPIGLCPNLRLLPQHRHQQQQPSVPHWQCAIVSSNVSVESTISSVLSIYRGIESRAVHHTLTPSSEPIDVATNWLFLATRKNYIQQSGTMLRQLPDDSTIGCGSRNRSRSSTLWVHVLKHVNNETKIKTGTVSDNNKERRNTDKRKQNPSVYCEKKKALQENLPRVSEDAFLFFLLSAEVSAKLFCVMTRPYWWARTSSRVSQCHVLLPAYFFGYRSTYFFWSWSPVVCPFQSNFLHWEY